MTTDGDEVTPPAAPSASGELDFWSFVELANRRLSSEYGFEHQLATEALLTLNRASIIVTHDLESAVHRPRGRTWPGFRLLFVIWLAGPLESKSAARLTGTSRAAVSNLAKTLVADGLLDRTPGEHDGRTVLLSLTEAGRREMIEVFRTHNEREHEWASVLTEVEQRILIMLLNKLIVGRPRTDLG